MKKILLLSLLGLLFVSCTTARIIHVADIDYETKFRSYEIELISESSAFFKVYKVNNSGYAILPYESGSSYSNADDLSRCLLFSEYEAVEFRNALSEFVEKCESNRNTCFFSEVKVKEGIADYTIDTVDSEKDRLLLNINTAFLLQAFTEEDMGKYYLRVNAISKYNELPYTIKLNDIKRLVEALKK